MMTSHTEELYDVIQLVRPLYKVLEATVALELTETGVTISQRAVLEQLLDHGTQTVPTIGRSLILPRQFIQKIVNELLERGYIERQKNAAHKRSALLVLTPEGKAIISQIKDRETAVMDPISTQIDHDDLKATKATMVAMIKAFSSHNQQRRGDEGGVSR